MMDSKNLVVYKQYTVRGVKFTVEINRLEKTVSFVELIRDGRSDHSFKPKEWVFAGRELQYMNGWLLILKAMYEVVEQLKVELETFKDEDVNEMLKFFSAIDQVKEEELK